MGRLHFGILAIAAGAALVLPTVTAAQIAGGLRAPTSKMDGARQAHTMTCFLASAGRPVPGINFDAQELMGEGLAVQTAAEPWLAEALEVDPASNLATLATPEGPVWIVFDRRTRACTVAFSAENPAELRAQFTAQVFDDDWKRKKDKSAHGSRFEMKVGGLKFVSAFPDVPAGSQVFAVVTRAN